MTRKLFTVRKMLVLAVVLFAVGSIVLWSARGPREPVFDGKPLSRWFTEGRDLQSGPTPRRLTKAELQSLGPAGLEWLGYMATQTSVWDMDEPSSSSDWLGRFKWWLRERRNAGFGSTFDRVRFRAISALDDLGQDAAPAIPSLVKAISTADHDSRLVAADALLMMGAISWPAVREAIRHGDPKTRGILIYKLDNRWSIPGQPPISPEEFADTVELLAPLTHDADEWVSGTAQRQLNACVEAWTTQPRVAEGMKLVAESLARQTDTGRRATARVLGNFDGQSGVAVPALTALAATPDLLTRLEILSTLAILEPDNSRWPTLLYALASSPDKAVAEAAERALIHAGK